MNWNIRIAWFCSFLKNTKNEYNIDPVSVYGLESAVQRSLTEQILTNEPKYNLNVFLRCGWTFWRRFRVTEASGWVSGDLDIFGFLPRSACAEKCHFACQRFYRNGWHGCVRFSKTLDNDYGNVSFGVRMMTHLNSEVFKRYLEGVPQGHFALNWTRCCG